MVGRFKAKWFGFDTNRTYHPLCLYFDVFNCVLLLAWSSVTWSWRQRWWTSTMSWTRRGKSTQCQKSSCVMQSGQRTMQSAGIRCYRKRWSNSSPPLVILLRTAVQPPTTGEPTALTPSGSSKTSRQWGPLQYNIRLLFIWWSECLQTGFGGCSGRVTMQRFIECFDLWK